MIDWIKCSDRLPELKRWVLCFQKKAFIEDFKPNYFVARRAMNYQEEVFSTRDRFYRIADVDYWAELPEIPND